VEQKPTEEIKNEIEPLSLDELEKEMRANINKRQAAKELGGVKKRPAKASGAVSVGKPGRPSPPADRSPMPYLNGVIYTNQNKFRAYKVRGDRIESGYQFNINDQSTIDRAWAKACEAVENDKRNMKS